MIARLVAAALGLTLSAAAPLPPPPTAQPQRDRLPFATDLAARPLLQGSAAWPRIEPDAAWRAIVARGTAGRQAGRWTYARSLIGAGRGDAALGVVEVMASDDADLALVPGWRRARGAALVLLHRPVEALAALADRRLIDDPETCLWRLRALVAAARPADALAALRCAMPALVGRTLPERAPFLLAMAQAAVATARYPAAVRWLAALPADDKPATLLRARLAFAQGSPTTGLRLLAPLTDAPPPALRAEARLLVIEQAIARRTIAPGEALLRLEALRFGWRGDATEQRALWLSMRLATEIRDTPATLAAGATLFRYFDVGAQTGALVTRLRATLAAALEPGAALSLTRGAGLFWDYRDLMPAGVEGDRLVEMLVGRLQVAGLYERAADLLQHRLATRAEDIEKGPLSVRVASLFILAGAPDKAVRTLRETDAIAYPAPMRADRRRVEAAALDLLGKPDEALATIQDVADADGLRAEIYWRARDWTRLAAQSPAASLARDHALSEVAQAVILRHAIALAMLGREAELAALNARYADAFARVPSGPTFALLTGQSDLAGSAALSRAMAALPAASPAGEIGDLLTAGHAAMAERPKS